MLDLTVNGKDHGGWLSMRVSRSIQQLSGSYSLETGPKTAANPLIRPGDLCKVSIRNEETDPKFQVIQGFVETLDGAGDENSVQFEVSGRDRTGDLVDSAITRIGEWRSLKFQELVADLASDFNIQVGIDSAIDTGAEISAINYDQGTTYQELIAEYAVQKQLLVYTQPNGQIFITRASTQRGSLSLVEGKNILNHTINLDWSEVFKEYLVKGSRQSQKNDPEDEVTQVEACAIDERFPRNRATIIMPDTEVTVDSAQEIADWNASTRMGKAEAYTATIQGWFPVFNEIAYVKIDSYDLDADMLIEGYELIADDGGKKTTFNVVHPRAFALLPSNIITKDSKDSNLLRIA